jgi:hypothetical protein
MAVKHRSNLLVEGAITGVIGATAVAVWFLIVDAVSGRMLYTPELLGEAFFSIFGPPAGESPLQYIIAYTIVHYLAFALVGTILAAIVRQADEDPHVLAGLVIGGAVFALASFGFVAFLSQGTRLGALAWWQIGAATILAAVLMGWYQWKTHPRLGAELQYALEGRGA